MWVLPAIPYTTCWHAPYNLYGPIALPCCVPPGPPTLTFPSSLCLYSCLCQDCLHTCLLCLMDITFPLVVHIPIYWIYRLYSTFVAVCVYPPTFTACTILLLYCLACQHLPSLFYFTCRIYYLPCLPLPCLGCVPQPSTTCAFPVSVCCSSPFGLSVSVPCVYPHHPQQPCLCTHPRFWLCLPTLLRLPNLPPYPVLPTLWDIYFVLLLYACHPFRCATPAFPPPAL